MIAKGLDSLNGTIKLQETCQEIIDSNEDSQWFDDFQNFCVMKNKDDEANLINDKKGFDSKYSLFASSNLDSLSKEFSEIWNDKGTSANDVWRTKMLSECQRLQEKMFIGDSEYFDFKKYCTNTNTR